LERIVARIDALDDDKGMRVWCLITAVMTTASIWGQARSIGYLDKDHMPDVIRIVPPAPALGDTRFTADMAIFHATRSLEGSSRWVLALSDDNVSLSGLYKAFSCALGTILSPENAPKTSALITRANTDAGSAANVLKQLYQHKRPFQVEEGDVCLSALGKAALERSPDYPSGHSTASWETGLVLSELAPDAATAILARARAFGQSRVVCGVHNASAVEAAWMTATAIFAAQNVSPEFRADVDTARSELAKLRTTLPKPKECALEAQTLSKSPY
jgi:acid phosphatase (class A)